jgi:hypothetical protein
VEASRQRSLRRFSRTKVVEDVAHAQWVFTVPKMLRVYFLHHRELRAELSRAAAQMVKELLAAAAGEEKGFRPGGVAAYVEHRHGGRNLAARPAGKEGEWDGLGAVTGQRSRRVPVARPNTH